MARSRSLTAIAAGYLVGMACYSGLPGPYLQLALEPALVRPLIAFLLPTVAAATYAILQHLWAHDFTRSLEFLPDTVYEAIVFRCMSFLMALHTLLLAELVGIDWLGAWAGRGGLVLLGLWLVSVGNLLPRTRPNLVIGLRTPRTLTDRRLWIDTHRMSGYVAVGLGAVLAISGAFVNGSTLPRVVGTAAMVAGIVLLRSYWRLSHA